MTKRFMTIWTIAFLALASLWAVAANAGPPKTMLEQQQEQYQKQLQAQKQNQAQDQAQDQSQHANAEIGAVSAIAEGSSVVNEGVSANITQNYESGVPDTVLVPNNNTATCISVLGISAANDSGSGMLGIPLPEKLLWWETPTATCNYEGAADDAFAAGEREMGWFWKCHVKSLWRPFRDKGEKKADAIRDCHKYAVGEVTDQQLISSLRNQLEFERNERSIERANCTESKNRMSAAWKESCEK